MTRNKTKDRKKKKADEEVKEDGAGGAVVAVSQESVDSWKEKGNKAFLANRFDEALEFYQKAIELDGKNHVLFSNRSACYAALKKFELALQDGDKCIQLAPDWPKGYFRKGEALFQMLRYPEAHITWAQGLKLDPEDKLLKPALKNLDELLTELKVSEAQVSSAANPESDKFSNMVQWLRDGGAKFPMLYMRYYTEDYRGVHSLTKIPSNTVVLYVPFSHIMTSEVAKASDIGQKIIAANVDLRSQHSYLAAFLCQEKHNPASFWKPYIDILPVKYRNMPIFFTDEELLQLKGSFTLEKIEDRKVSLRTEYENICRAVPEFRRYTHWEFVWARLVVITRIFGLVIKGNKTDGLVPYADMLNHKIPRETKWTYDEDVEGFTITSLKTLQRGEEVFDSYGRKCNSRFFVNYGFSLDDNEDNEVVLKVALPTTDSHYDMKIRFLGGRPENANREYQVPATYKEKKTKDLFSFLRFVHARDDEIVMLPSDPAKIDDIEPISARNELAVLKHIKQAAQAVLAGFPTSLEEDDAILKKPREEVDANVRNCVVMRAGEKRVLHWFIDLCNNAAPLFEMNWKDLKQKAAKAYQENSPFDFYVTSVIIPLRKPHKV